MLLILCIVEGHILFITSCIFETPSLLPTRSMGLRRLFVATLLEAERNEPTSLSTVIVSLGDSACLAGEMGPKGPEVSGEAYI